MTKLSDTQIEELAWEKQNGLIPAIVQHYHTGQVLMLGYMNKTAIHRSQINSKVTFYSRSKQRLWTKGESSNNWLSLISISADCDSDTLLVQAIPQGPTCHKGTTSCWNEIGTDHFLQNLIHLIAQRKQEPESSSYTQSLFKAGTKRIAQKVGEEGVETALAAAVNDNDELTNESADLLFHLLVLLENQNVSYEKIIACLSERHIKK
ncbi:bifunctional phosphoribosyl-AMP cyclohydrolase/phosphoribosyl-ATP diphosphatase HisIE [Parashewanella spongiae]|uniref:Histidine biosynthesis bifunctional protein HisIE n=1 Tax=Parashewanella spongiae TaxID=342950 RepID=A0A3A6UC50_9GAMM|nr:bifunctional phosphoribosyl-AMP cyclohydrolase/phosphoribosyl-ATP diphosphatase HisIE [Parashewanella spongiae]MCL1076831.1 bifunctional phosphoribosyl-AMP cyclohydrolase/phosphoribosyl-ATP diphosphatase HisIE [Parashewanella spongiae]RJY19199.1 bifunctional phosphoribosyl-AMP cyclohydrolase/phosphoribosyl-ATP diphosphatase HisIE [Parashewanella spongiae]